MTGSDRPGKLCGAVREAGGRLAGDVANLVRAGREPKPEVVHDIRVGAKRLRAWWRLLRPATDSPPDLTEARERLRQLGAALGGLRDAEVLQRTLREIAGDLVPQTYTSVAAILSALYPVQSLPPSKWAELSTAIAAEQYAWESLAPDACNEAMVVASLGRSYRRARQCGKRALASGQLDDFHAWRKAVKALTYQLEVVGSVTGETGVPVPDYRKLGNRLGQVHDLSVLAQQLARPEFETVAAELGPLFLALEARRNHLTRSCGKAFHRLFHSKTKDLVRTAIGAAR
jgi:CHAD domain-containing protein